MSSSAGPAFLNAQPCGYDLGCRTLATSPTLIHKMTDSWSSAQCTYVTPVGHRPTNHTGKRLKSWESRALKYHGSAGCTCLLLRSDLAQLAHKSSPTDSPTAHCGVYVRPGSWLALIAACRHCGNLYVGARVRAVVRRLAVGVPGLAPDLPRQCPVRELRRRRRCFCQQRWLVASLALRYVQPVARSRPAGGGGRSTSPCVQGVLALPIQGCVHWLALVDEAALWWRDDVRQTLPREAGGVQAGCGQSREAVQWPDKDPGRGLRRSIQ